MTLGEIGPEAKTAAFGLASLLKESDATTIGPGPDLAAAEALGRIGPDAIDAIPAHAELLTQVGEHHAARSAAIATLKKIAVQARSATDASVRRAAAWAIWRIRLDPEIAIPSLTELLKDQDSSVRAAAAWSLGGIAPESKAAIPALIELLQDKDAWARRAAAEAVGLIGPDATAAVVPRS